MTEALCVHPFLRQSSSVLPFTLHSLPPSLLPFILRPLSPSFLLFTLFLVTVFLFFTLLHLTLFPLFHSLRLPTSSFFCQPKRWSEVSLGKCSSRDLHDKQMRSPLTNPGYEPERALIAGGSVE